MKRQLSLLAALCLAIVQAWGQTTVASGTCGAEGDGSNITWTLTDDGTLTLSGTGAVAGFAQGAQPWQAHKASIRTAVVGEGVTRIGDWFLRGCTSLTSLTLPGGLTGVGEGFLIGCRGLTSLTLPDGLKSVGGEFLSSCFGLTSLTLPEGLESIGDVFLGWCTGLTSLTLPEGVKSIGDAFLYGCTGLEELTVRAATPPSIGSEDAFGATAPWETRASARPPSPGASPWQAERCASTWRATLPYIYTTCRDDTCWPPRNTASPCRKAPI